MKLSVERTLFYLNTCSLISTTRTSREMPVTVMQVQFCPTYFEKERFRDDLFYNEDVCAASAAKTLKYFIVFGLQSRYFEI